MNFILAVGGMAIAGIAAIPALLGFGTSGVVAGSVAAGIQSSIGNVVAGSIFSLFTSLGMTGWYIFGIAGGILTSLSGILLKFIPMYLKKFKK